LKKLKTSSGNIEGMRKGGKMGIISDEEKKRITEEEELRASIRKKHEQKSSGTAGVLSTVCPGLGQIYNGQVGKGAFFFLVILISVTLLSLGILFWIQGVPGKGETTSIVGEEEAVEISEDGIVMEEETEGEEEETEKKTIPPLAGFLTIVGLAGLALGGNYSVRDAIKTAKRLNET